MFCTNCGNSLEARASFCVNCGKEIKVSLFAKHTYKIAQFCKNNKRLGVAIAVIVLLLWIIIDLSQSGTNQSDSNKSNLISMPTHDIDYRQQENALIVVNILCPSTVSDEEPTGGSGTLISSKGIVLTNSHIIPQDTSTLHVDESGCIVVLPDPATGQVKDIYLAHPIVLHDLSDAYDLAFLSIYSAYYDDEEGEYLGVYPREFPVYVCESNDVKLGDPVRVFGYPAISGGYSLTVTDGIVSSLSPSEGLIYISAKISHGNSGGLAVDKNGCMIGVPSMVSSDENESLGIIYSMDLVNEFASQVSETIQ